MERSLTQPAQSPPTASSAPTASSPSSDLPFARLATQVEAARRAVLAVPSADRGVLVVTGGDRLSWLNGLLTCDLARRAPGEGVYGLAVARSGRVLADAVVIVDDAAERVLLVIPRAASEALRAHLDHYLVMEDAEVAPGEGFEVWALQGPRSAEALAAAAAQGAVGARVDRSGHGGAVLVALPGQTAAVRSAVESAAVAAGGLVGDDDGWDALRLERAVPRFGVDFDERTYPQEAALERAAVSFDKGCYLGQEVVCMLEMRGHVKRKLVPLVVESEVPPERGAAVTDGAGVGVGEVTSAAWSPTLGKVVALAMVKRACAEAGTELEVGAVRAKVVDRPTSG